MTEMSDRKKRILEHLSRSGGYYQIPSNRRSPERKQQILDHVKRTKG